MHTTLFDSRYFGPRQPAWHHLGQVASEPVGAVDAFRRAGRYDVVLAQSDTPDSWDIRRKPTQVDRRWRTFATVGQDYVLVPPDEITEIWDLHVQQPVETLGAVRYGRILFITMRMPSFDVRGDVLDSYLVLAHWMDATGMTEIFVAPVRVVCQNTLMMARRLARQQITLTHSRHVREHMAERLRSAVRDLEARTARLREACERLADKEADESDVAAVLTAAYPSSLAPRRAARELFNGAGTGMELAAARGTLWGLFNAVAELENFRDGDTLNQAAYSVLFGLRGAAMERAFSAAVLRTKRATPHTRSVAEMRGRQGGTRPTPPKLEPSHARLT